MDISIFEVIGPVMLGPSSSGTAGMARIGATAHKFLTAPLKSIHITVTPRFETGYIACRSHFALIGGVLGLSEDDPRLRDALTLAKEQGIALSYSVFPSPVPEHALTIRLAVEMENNLFFSITAVSVGGGSIEVLAIDDYEVEISPSAHHLFLWSDSPLALQQLTAIFPGTIPQQRTDNRGAFCCIPLLQAVSDEAMTAVRTLPGVKKVIYTPPFLPYGFVPHQPLFTSFSQLVQISEETGKDIAELAIEYEMGRSGRSRDDIWRQMEYHLDIMRQAMHRGIEQPITPLYGFNKGDGGKRLYQASLAGKTMGGSTLSRAIAYALATMEYSMSLGRVVAAPTGGSCGIVPGCLLTVQEDKALLDDDLIRALFVCAAVGVVMYYHGTSFSGSQGGCQGEVGVSSAMAAGGLTYLSGAGSLAVVHGAALAMKNILGLICDPLKACDEVPCIKRNGIGVANAFSGADMAIAGITSFIPPDEVIESLVELQRIMPVEMRGSGCGARGTKTGLASEQWAMDLCRDITLPLKAPTF